MSQRWPAIRRSRITIWLLAAVAMLIAAGVVLAVVLTTSSDDEVEEYTIRGMEYSTNQEIEELRGDIYVYVFVNTDVDDIVFEVENPADNEEVRNFFDHLDTFVPGEHELVLTDVTLRIIVDGMEE